MNKFAYYPSSKPESINSFSNASAHNGVDGACFIKIGFPNINGGTNDLNGIQNGKFQGTISRIGPIASCVTNDLNYLVL